MAPDSNTLSAPDSKRRRKLAELEVLVRFDSLRETAGHDYGNGQRYAELRRRTRELVPGTTGHTSHGLLELRPELEELTGAELFEAFERVGRKRLRRVEADSNRWGWTPTAQRTARTWRRLAASLTRGAKLEEEGEPLAIPALSLPELTTAGRAFAERDGGTVSRIALAAAAGAAEDWPISYRRTAIEACNAKGEFGQDAGADREPAPATTGESSGGAAPELEPRRPLPGRSYSVKEGRTVDTYNEKELEL